MNERPELTYGADWRRTRRRYLRSRWTRKRCFWCRTRGDRTNPIELNHLTYARGDRPRWWQVKPLCRRCHAVETFVTRVVRVFLPWSMKTRAHYLVTYGVRWVRNLVVAVLLAYAVVWLCWFGSWAWTHLT